MLKNTRGFLLPWVRTSPLVGLATSSVAYRLLLRLARMPAPMEDTLARVRGALSLRDQMRPPSMNE
ncbi:hypothetical protein D3C81_2332890 [compost metagenome]